MSRFVRPINSYDGYHANLSDENAALRLIVDLQKQEKLKLEETIDKSKNKLELLRKNIFYGSKIENKDAQSFSECKGVENLENDLEKQIAALLVEKKSLENQVEMMSNSISCYQGVKEEISKQLEKKTKDFDTFFEQTCKTNSAKKDEIIALQKQQNDLKDQVEQLQKKLAEKIESRFVSIIKRENYPDDFISFNSQEEFEKFQKKFEIAERVVRPSGRTEPTMTLTEPKKVYTAE